MDYVSFGHALPPLPFKLNHPIRQFAPSLYTGTPFAPPPATAEAKVVALASVTKDRAPAPAVAAAGRPATVFGVVFKWLSATMTGETVNAVLVRIAYTVVPPTDRQR